MYAQLFTHSPLLILPILSLALFAAVFVAIVVRVFARRAAAYDATASLPLDPAGKDDKEARHV